MANYYIIVRDGERSYRLDITYRDWSLLFGPGFEKGRQFIQALGVYDHYTVAGGVPKGSKVSRNKSLLAEIAKHLLRDVERDADLLCYNYSYSFSSEGKVRHGGAQSGFRVRGYKGHISTRPSGFCQLKLSQIGVNGTPRVVEIIDMRIRKQIDTDELGVLKIFRRSAEVHWQVRLPPFIEFLHSLTSKEVIIEHYE